ncbi:MAG: hypothetical protein CVU59_08180, partial [Deltaproteobacteria bacterium HGW-Deltaproteobacteria-17]
MVIFAFFLNFQVSSALSKPKPPCPAGAKRDKAGVCHCPKDQKLHAHPKGGYCVPVTCVPGQFRGSDGRCYCAAGTAILPGATRCVPRNCAADQIRGKDMTCKPRCGVSDRWSPKAAACVPRKCPARQ